jgi:glutamyl-tRNA reductase
VGVIGLSYRTADLDLREEFARISEKISGERALFFKHPTVQLCTCNRTEIYFSADDLAESHSDLLAFFRLHMKTPFEHRLYAYFGIDCFCHLSRVASGLEAAVLAETEIQSQVKLAYGRAASALALPSCIHYIFQKSLRVAKFARNSFYLEKGASTLYGTVWHAANEHFADLKMRRILLVGYSEINRGFAAFLTHRGVRDFFLATRYPSQVHLEGAIVRGRELISTWPSFDLIISAAKSNDYLIRGSGRGHNLIFDLSVPRVADPHIQSATIWNIEQINQRVEQNRRLAKEGLEQGRECIHEYVDRLAKIYRRKNERVLELRVAGEAGKWDRVADIF